MKNILVICFYLITIGLSVQASDRPPRFDGGGSSRGEDTDAREREREERDSGSSSSDNGGSSGGGSYVKPDDDYREHDNGGSSGDGSYVKPDDDYREHDSGGSSGGGSYVTPGDDYREHDNGGSSGGGSYGSSDGNGDSSSSDSNGDWGSTSPEGDPRIKDLEFTNVTRRTGGEWLRLEFSRPEHVNRIQLMNLYFGMKIHDAYAILSNGDKIVLHELIHPQTNEIDHAIEMDTYRALYSVIAIDIRAESMGGYGMLKTQIHIDRSDTFILTKRFN